MELVFVAWILSGITCAILASSRGRNPIGWFVLGFAIPLFAIILVLGLPSKAGA